FDVETGFLYAPLKEELYIKTPEGSNQKTPFLCLEKSLYRLKQAPANWYETLTSWFNEIDFHHSSSAPCLYIHHNKNSIIFFHFDDSIVVDHTLTQDKLIQKGINLLGLHYYKPFNTPLSVGVQLEKATKDKKKDFKNLNINYRTFTGILNYLSCQTQPDLAPAVSIPSSFNNEPGIHHWKQVVHCWNPEDFSDSLQNYTDTTWANDLETCLSCSGSICLWKSCPTVFNKINGSGILLKNYGKKIQPTLFHIDKKGSLDKIQHFGSNLKTKHSDIKMKWLRDLKVNNEISVVLIPSEDMIADSLTKSSNAESLNCLKDFCFLVHYSSSCAGG
ncbi:hypothetical protein VP01_1049g5, partial [Puccinia sorghi]